MEIPRSVYGKGGVESVHRTPHTLLSPELCLHSDGQASGDFAFFYRANDGGPSHLNVLINNEESFFFQKGRETPSRHANPHTANLSL